MFMYHCPNIELLNQIFVRLCMLFWRSFGCTQFRYTCNKRLQWQKDVDLAHQKLRLCIVPSCGCHTSVEVFGKDSPLLEYSRCYMSTHIYLIERKPRSKIVKHSWFMEGPQPTRVIRL